MSMPSPSNQDRGGVPRLAALEMADGTSAEAAFFDGPGQTLFGVAHVPKKSNGCGVVICSPIYNDYLKNNRREVLLARRLATSGFTVQRFQYAGTGNSEGAIADMTLDSMIADTEAATELLRRRDGVDQLAFMGTRMGAISAASWAAATDAPLAMWEPTEGVRYFRELFRTMAIIEMNSDGGGANLADLKAGFEANRSMDAAGYEVGWAFYESSERSLLEVVGRGNAPLLIAQFREKAELKAEYQKLVSAWEADGRSVHQHHVLVEEAWMLFVYGFRAEEEREHSRGLIDATTSWFEGLA